MGTTIASTLLMLWTFFKIRNISTALLILQYTKVVKSLATDMPSFVYKSPTKPSAAPIIFQFDFDLAWDHVIFILCLLNFACFLLNAYCMVRKFKRINASVLKLEVTSGYSCVLLPVLKLPLCPVFCHIEMPHDVANLSVHGPWHSKKLYLNWDNFSVTNTLTNHTMLVPEKLNQIFGMHINLKRF